MRTTIDLDPTVLTQLKVRQRREGTTAVMRLYGVDFRRSLGIDALDPFT